MIKHGVRRENVEFLSSFSHLGIAQTSFGSALGLTKTFDFIMNDATEQY